MNLKYTSKDVIANLLSAVKNQAIQDAKSVFAKYKKAVRTNGKLKLEDQKQIKVPVLKKTVAIWNNQNYSLKGNILSFPVIVDGKSKRIKVIRHIFRVLRFYMLIRNIQARNVRNVENEILPRIENISAVADTKPIGIGLGL